MRLGLPSLTVVVSSGRKFDDQLSSNQYKKQGVRGIEGHRYITDPSERCRAIAESIPCNGHLVIALVSLTMASATFVVSDITS